jgi:endonuclease YncB( thermonuclease family)
MSRATAFISGLLLISPAATASQDDARFEIAGHVEVIDADTLRVELRGHPVEVQLLGVDAPEGSQSGLPQECLGDEAAGAAREFLASDFVALERDPRQPDRDVSGRLVRYVYRYPDGKELNRELVNGGYARVLMGIPFSRQREYLEFQATAQRLRQGVWGDMRCGASDPSSAATESVSPCLSRGTTKLDEVLCAFERHEDEVLHWTVPMTGQRSRSTACCMHCDKGKPCGNSCISVDKECHQPPGCAC